MNSAFIILINIWNTKPLSPTYLYSSPKNYTTQNALFFLPPITERMLKERWATNYSHMTFPVKMADNLPSDFDVIVIGTGMCGPGFS